MPLTHVQNGTAASTQDVSSLAVSLPSPPSTGNLVLLAANSDSTLGTPIGWTLAESAVDFTGLYLWYRTAQAGDGASVTVPVNAPRCCVAVLAEYTGQAASPLDQTATATPGGTGQTTITIGPTADTAQGDELAVACVGWHDAGPTSSVSWGDSFTALAGLVSTGSTINDGLWVATRALVSTGPVQASATYSTGVSHPGAALATFRVSAAVEASGGLMAPGMAAAASMSAGPARAAAISGRDRATATMRGV